MEFHGFHAFVHDCVQSLMRRMDREYVGLHVRRRCVVHSILPRYRSDRQSSRKCHRPKLMLLKITKFELNTEIFLVFQLRFSTFS